MLAKGTKGKDLILSEGALVAKGGKVHIVFDHRICRPSIIDGLPERGERIWKIIEALTEPGQYKRTVLGQKLKCCSFCLQRLEKAGFKQL
ncbi:MAG TPA: hypothetical protein PLG94_13775 [Smithellaceae bacterium]|jgi:hypothetical protein|nr:hypothetical protein [Smithellaceae bacterium]